ncbi:hypothetical protein [Paenibacillus silvestris]|uniref:hypothetical protein n=1 Tax=Paenibacillus silvestris TaxID=2606219 RepID=UPI0013736A12|nr:hypothetical protein [Paenibacillus silvestris]
MAEFWSGRGGRDGKTVELSGFRSVLPSFYESEALAQWGWLLNKLITSINADYYRYFPRLIQFSASRWNFYR